MFFKEESQTQLDLILLISVSPPSPLCISWVLSLEFTVTTIQIFIFFWMCVVNLLD